MVLKSGKLPFTVDTALLKELGERLVGKPHIALAELIKNGYDADATEVVITLDKGKDEIVVRDNGHGMTFEEFKNYWMRIGSTHKSKRMSKKYGRPMTGSKGIGRLSAQFLAKKLEIYTCSDDMPDRRLKASVNWKKATETGELTKVEIEYEIEMGDDFPLGTLLVLKGLKNPWEPNDLKNLAKETWRLQPPFRGGTERIDPKHDFQINLVSHKELVEPFEHQIKAILDIWHARIVGHSDYGDISIAIEWAGKKPRRHLYKREGCKLAAVDFEIRLYHLTKRQPRGINVGEAREYLNEYGGVNIYDGGFRLPYYGNKRNDWLGTELDHSHRKTASEFLPEAIRKGVARGLQFLPTLSRQIGVVKVDTSRESSLEILVTRDRLKETGAYEDLIWIIRYALDLYALWEKIRVLKEKEPVKETTKEKIRKVEEVFDDYEAMIPEETLTPLRKEIAHSMAASRTEAEEIAAQVGLVGSLATAGITSLAYQHETKALLNIVSGAVNQLSQIESSVRNAQIRASLRGLREDLSSWLKRAEMANALFSHLADPENIGVRKRFRAQKLIEDISKQIESLMRKIPISVKKVDSELYLPKASIAEWSSIFQNIFLNSHNAMLAAKKKSIEVSSKSRGLMREIIVQDTGYGVNLKTSGKLFETFVRDSKIPSEMRAAGYGGSGLGLTIVRIIAHNIGCNVSFVEPEKGFGAAFSIRWRETG